MPLTHPTPIVPRRRAAWLVQPPRALRVGAACAAVLLTAVLFHQGSQPYASGLIGAPFDKLAHATFFGIIAGLAWIALGANGRRANIGAVALAVGLGVLDEVVQSFLPGRVASVADVVADGIGAVLVVTVLSNLRARLRQQDRPGGIQRDARRASVGAGR
jgi:VanZ family protein